MLLSWAYWSLGVFHNGSIAIAFLWTMGAIFSGTLLHFPFLYLKQIFEVMKMLQIKMTFGLWSHQDLFWLRESWTWSWFRIRSRKSPSPCFCWAGTHSRSCDVETLPPQQLLMLWSLRSLLLLLVLSGVAVEEQVLFVSAGGAGKEIAGILQRLLRTVMGWVTVRLSAVHCCNPCSCCTGGCLRVLPPIHKDSSCLLLLAWSHRSLT